MVMSAFSKKDSTFLKSYFQEKLKKKTQLKKATYSSYQDIAEKLKEFYSQPKPFQLILLIRSFLNSSVWIGNATFLYFISLLDFSQKSPDPQNDELALYILNRVASKSEINYKKASYTEIFKTIFNDLEFAHHNPEYKSKLEIPKLNCTIILVPGVLNEIFTTPAFARGALYLSKKFNLKIFAPKVIGTKSSHYNQELLKEQLYQYIEKNPEEKLWILCFSKGGLDTLHFLSHNQDFAHNYILGISTIASPILGSDNLDHQLLKILSKVHKYHNNFIYQFFDKKFDVLLKEFQESLSSEYQADWFKKNHSSLPKNLFYTAIAFEAEWYNSHIWMVLAKAFFQSQSLNDGVVDVQNALFPDYFKGLNLGILKGHHLVGTRSSTYCQEALLEAHLIFLNYLDLIR